jgi:hypothetical protein
MCCWYLHTSGMSRFHARPRLHQAVRQNAIEVSKAPAAAGTTLDEWPWAPTVLRSAAADLILTAVNWSKLPAAHGNLPDWRRRIVIDATNPIETPLFQPIDLTGIAHGVRRPCPWRTRGESLQPPSAAPHRRQPAGGRWPASAVYAGNDEDAK